MSETIKIEDHPECEMVTIDGINFAYPLFKVFGKGEIGRPFIILERNDGYVICKRYNQELESRLEVAVVALGKIAYGRPDEADPYFDKARFFKMIEVAKEALAKMEGSK